MSTIETPKYTVLKSAGPIEEREYAATIVAEVEVQGERGTAINAGFRMLADYIFGNNLPKQTIAMTAPVFQQKGAKIAMTAPVTQIKDGSSWKVQFTMPSAYALDTLPQPANEAVKIKLIPSYRCVAVRFSGLWNQESLKKHSILLDTYCTEHDLKKKGEPIYAFYNPPWTLPMFRRNEVMYVL